MAKPTPGPWIVTDACQVITDWPKVGFLTTVANCRIGGGSHDEQRATARLIAAAPELLKALKQAAIDLTEKLEESGELADSVTIALIHAAIAKAESQA